MDRTNEFRSLLKVMENEQSFNRNGLRERKGGSVSAAKQARNGQDKKIEYINFMRATRAIFKDLAMTFNKLEKLNELARKRTIFDSDESSVQLNELVYIIKQDVYSLNQQIEELRKNQPDKARDSNKNTVDSYSKNVVLNLQEQLATMSNDFKSTLELRTQNMQQQKLRREQFTSSTPAVSGQKSSSTLIDFGDDPGLSSANTSQSDQRIQEQRLLQFDDATAQYVEERANTMQTIESTIVELGGIFNQLATMVHQQDEMIVRIDANISDTQMNVEAAHESLLRYLQTVSNNRWLMFKVFGVLFFFFLLFVMMS